MESFIKQPEATRVVRMLLVREKGAKLRLENKDQTRVRDLTFSL